MLKKIMADPNNLNIKPKMYFYVLGLFCLLDEQHNERNCSAVNSTAIQTVKTFLYEGFEELSLFCTL